jgi:hypothetical protein
MAVLTPNWTFQFTAHPNLWELSEAEMGVLLRPLHLTLQAWNQII